MFRTERVSRKIVSLLLVVLLASGCSSWRVLEGPQASTLERDDGPNKVRLTLLDGTKVTVYDPTLSGDSLIGYDYTRTISWTSRERIAIPMAEVQVIEHRKFNLVKTLAWTLGPPIILFGAVAIALSGSNCCGLGW